MKKPLITRTVASVTVSLTCFKKRKCQGHDSLFLIFLIFYWVIAIPDLEHERAGSVLWGGKIKLKLANNSP